MIGPTADHTQQNKDGYFIYADSLEYHNENEKVRIESPFVDSESSYECLEFYYHAFGIDVNTLNVYIKQGGELGVPIWTRSKNQGDEWLRGEIRIRNIRKTYSVVFESVMGAKDKGVNN